MFNWLGNIFPYSDLHSLNLDWILSKMKETAAHAAKAVADAANALAQVAEAKAAALSAQTAAQNAQTAANNAQTAANNAQTAADNAADSAENAIAEAQAAKSAAQTAQNTANTAQSAAQTAQSAAQTAQNTANTAQETATAANSTANTLAGKFPIKNDDIANDGILNTKFAYPRTAIMRKLSVTIPSSTISNVFDITYTNSDISGFFYAINTGTFCFAIDYKIADGSNDAKKYIVLNPILSPKSLISPAFYYDENTDTIIQGTLNMKHAGSTLSLKLNFPQTPDLSSLTNPIFSVNLYFVYTDISKKAGI